MDRQVLPRFGTTPLIKITNAAVRAWVAEMLDAGPSAATTRKAVFALRRCLAAAMADRRLMSNPAADVPQPSERARPRAWAGHNSVAFTFTRSGGLFEDGSAETVDRLEALLGGGDPPSRRAVSGD